MISYVTRMHITDACLITQQIGLSIVLAGSAAGIVGLNILIWSAVLS